MKYRVMMFALSLFLSQTSFGIEQKCGFWFAHFRSLGLSSRSSAQKVNIRNLIETEVVRELELLKRTPGYEERSEGFLLNEARARVRSRLNSLEAEAVFDEMVKGLTPQP